MLDTTAIAEFLQVVAPLCAGRFTLVTKNGEHVLSAGSLPNECSAATKSCLGEAEFALKPFSIFACEHGVRHMAVPLNVGDDRVGILVLSQKVLSFELQRGIQNIAEYVVGQFQLKKPDVEREHLLHRARFLPQLLVHSQFEAVCDAALSYLVHSFRLSNACILSSGKRMRYNQSRQLEPILSQVEQVLLRQAEETKTVFVVRSAKDDVLTSRLAGVERVEGSIAVFPLCFQRVVLGVLLVFSDGQKDVELLGALAQQLSLALQLSLRYLSAAQSARTDPLTGLANRAAMVELLSSYLPEAREGVMPTSLAVIDIDDFKQYNDTKGHLAGDELLQSLAKVMGEVLPDDARFRYGGEEFIVLLMKTGQVEAQERVQRLLEVCATKLGVTVSVGLVTCMNSSLGTYELVNEADKALYKSKKNGKNMVSQVVVVDKNLGVIDVEQASMLGKRV